MPIISLQRRQTEVGRIRIGEVKDTGRKKSNGEAIVRPAKLDSFRFTTASRALADHVQKLYGGAVAEWEPQGGGAKQWEVVTTAKSLPVIVPPNSVSQWYETWSGGGCTRRCDGEREMLTDKPCLCDPDPTARECKPTTRINVMLADVPGIGVWRLETHGFYAATELPAVAELLAAGGGYIPARLELQERSAKRPKANGQGIETRRWMVPVLHVDASPMAMLSGNAPRIELTGSDERPAIAAAAAEMSDEMLDELTEGTAHETAAHYRLIAEHAKDLGEVQQAWRDAKAVGVLDESLAADLRKRGDELTPAKTQQSAEPAIKGDADEPDADAVWLQIVTAGGDQGWQTSDIETRVIARFNKSSDECNGWQLTEFLSAVKSGEIS